MEDKRLREKLYMPDQELTFTKEDRNRVFEQIHTMNDHTQKKYTVPFYKRLVPITLTLAAAGLCVFLYISSNPLQNITADDPAHNAAASADQEEDGVSTALFMLKDEENRIPINLLLTYSKEKDMLKVVSVPRDTYAPIGDKDGGAPSYDKLTFAYADGPGGAENARLTVSKLFNLPIDHYAVMDLDIFSELIDSVNGIDYELKEDMKVRAISRVSFEFKKGKNRLDGEQVAALMMAATEGRIVDEENLISLMGAVINKTKKEISEAQLKKVTSKIETNFSIDDVLNHKIDSRNMESLSLSEGMSSESIDGRYYLMFEEDFLHSVSEELTAF